jgi:hypothetical protein
MDFETTPATPTTPPPNSRPEADRNGKLIVSRTSQQQT